MIIGVPKEIKLQEHRIGLTPESVKVLYQKGHKILVEKNGGLEAGFTDQDYKNSGAVIYENPKDIFKEAEIIVKVKEPQMSEVEMIREGQIIYTYFHFASSLELTKAMIDSKSSQLL